jgi:hypothetical protein
MTPFVIYVAGPYSAETEHEVNDNICRACAAGKAIIDRGHWPLIPHLNAVYDLWYEDHYGQRPDYELFMRWDLALLERCDGLLYLAPSPGADRERALAWEWGKVVWMRVEDIPAGELGMG